MSTENSKAAKAPKTSSSKLDQSKPFAVVATDGKQYVLQQGSTVKLAKIDAEKGAQITLDNVLLVGGEGSDIKVGTPSVSGASISCKVLKHAKSKKVIIFKKKRRKGYTKKQGHRQDYTEVLVEAINF